MTSIFSKIAWTTRQANSAPGRQHTYTSPSKYERRKGHEAESEYVTIVATTLIALKMLLGAHGDDSRVINIHQA